MNAIAVDPGKYELVVGRSVIKTRGMRQVTETIFELDGVPFRLVTGILDGAPADEPICQDGYVFSQAGKHLITGVKWYNTSLWGENWQFDSRTGESTTGRNPVEAAAALLVLLRGRS